MKYTKLLNLLYMILFFTSGGSVDQILVVVHQINDKGFQFDGNFIQCQTSTSISEIVNEII